MDWLTRLNGGNGLAGVMRMRDDGPMQKKTWSGWVRWRGAELGQFGGESSFGRQNLCRLKTEGGETAMFTTP